MNRKKIGHYIERDVHLIESKYLLTDYDDLSNSSVLLWLQTKKHLMTLRSYLRQLIEKKPLVLFLGGLYAEAGFDHLLDELSRGAPSFQVMTRYSEQSLEDCLEEFFQASWPSEDRFDDWKNYIVSMESQDLHEGSRVAHTILSSTDPVST